METPSYVQALLTGHSFNKNMRCMETKVLVSYIVTVNADTPTQAPFFPLYYTKMISRNLEWLLPA